MRLWIFNKKIDLLVLGLPVWLTWVWCFSMSDSLLNANIPLWMWVSIILLCDVSHVWSTIFRTYLDKEEFQLHRKALTFTPIIVFAIVFIVCSISPTVFWRIMAYLALFHFIKQQYGFFAIYSRKYGVKQVKRIFKDKTILYFSMVYPVLHWHFVYTGKFNWFVDNDFLNLKVGLRYLTGNENFEVASLFEVLNYVYFIILIGWLIEDLRWYKKNQEPIAYGKIIWLLTTAFNWYLGIVYFNSDVAFTITNCIAHGIPYLTLVFFYVERKKEIKENRLFKWNRWAIAISFMLLIILVLAHLEEYSWDMFINRDSEKGNYFQSLFTYPFELLKTPVFQAIVVALLSIPQITHYIIDGVIWKGNSKNPYLKAIFFEKRK